MRSTKLNSAQAIIKSSTACIFLPLAFLAAPALLEAQKATAPPTPDASNPSSSGYVSRAEYDKLKAEHEAMKQELDALKETVKQLTAGAAQTPAPAKAVSEEKQVVAVPP
ncbi:MAG TPA: hypothetical protein VFU37_01640 [Pyrinomonadaceae bacterium]|nr:hypothetical protein [Pyrinomonadaceae bacterium]